MTGRTVALVATLGMIGLLTYLTFDVMINHGVDVLVITSFVILGWFAFGIVGALLNPPRD